MDKDGHEIEKINYAPTQEEAEALGTNAQPLPLEDDEWMDGLEVADVPDTMGEAVKIRNMGQAAYEAMLQKEARQTPEALYDTTLDLTEMVIEQKTQLIMLEMGL